jgi:hypothetical protein
MGRSFDFAQDDGKNKQRQKQQRRRNTVIPSCAQTDGQGLKCRLFKTPRLCKVIGGRLGRLLV